LNNPFSKNYTSFRTEKNIGFLFLIITISTHPFPCSQILNHITVFSLPEPSYHALHQADGLPQRLARPEHQRLEIRLSPGRIDAVFEFQNITNLLMFSAPCVP